MKIGIHNRPGSFSDRWIDYCQKNNIQYKLVNCYDTDIVFQLEDCDALMWHHHHANYKDVLFAKQLLYSLEQCGKKTFPDYKTSWHFDDKVGQKYLFESIGAPFVPSYVFYTKQEAMEWIKQTTFPKVFKLRGGAGAANVKLAKSANQARSLVNIAFGKGFAQFDRIGYFKERLNKFYKGKDNLEGVLKGFGRLFIKPEFAKFHCPEKGYIYFQDYIPDNNYDFRIKVIGNYCWGFRRAVRENDFRASGSGKLDFDTTKIPIKMVQIAFEISSKLNLQSVAFDFVIDNKEQPLVIEMSYCFGVDQKELTHGFWTSNLVYNENYFNPFNEMIINL